MGRRNVFIRGAVTLSLAAAALLATYAVARAGIASHSIGKRPYIVRRPFVNDASLLVLGGGDTLAAAAFSGKAAAAGPQPAVAQAPGSILGYFDAKAPLPVNAGANATWLTSYCQAGSEFGIGVVNGTNAQPDPCPSPGVSPVAGRNAFDASGETDGADFTVSDTPVTQAQYSALASNLPVRGEFVQVPFIASSVAIAFHNVDVAGHYLKLTIPEICQIADGEITDWDQIPRAADPTVTRGNPTQPVGATNPGFPEKPIVFTYRADNNGLTLAFTNFLSATVRSNPSHCTGAGETWGLNDSFVQALPTPAFQDTSNFVGAAGNAAVVASIEQQDGSIGYVEPVNTQAIPHLFHTYLAKIYTLPVNLAAFLKDPIADLPAAAKLVTSFKKDGVVVLTCGNGGIVGTIATPCTSAAGRPVPDLVAASGVYRAGCLGIVDPASYAAPPLGYPIVAVSNLEFYSSGNGVYSPGLRFLGDLLASPSTVFGPGGLTTVDKAGTAAGTTGFSSLGIADVFYSNPTIGLLPQCID